MVAVRFSVVWGIVAGLAWPLALTGVGGALFPRAATGSVVWRDGVAVGSAWVGQPFSSDRYLIGRPSACGWDGTAAAGSNLAPSDPALRDRVAAAADAIAAREGVRPDQIPPEWVAASGSGVDPELGLAAARLQLPRIAAARAVPVARLEALLAERARGTGWASLGPPRVDVLGFNLALDALPREGG